MPRVPERRRLRRTNRTAAAMPPCGSCGDGHGEPKAVEVRGPERTITYRCSTCNRSWTQTDWVEAPAPGPRAVSEPVERAEEREWLSRERARLRQQHEELKQAGQFVDFADAAALRERLGRHREELRAFRRALALFYAKYGLTPD